MLFEPIEAFEHLGQTLKDSNGAQPDAVVEARRAGDHFAGRHIVRDGRLRGENDAVADGAMAGDANLAGKDDVVADDGRAGEAGLRADECIVADAGTVANLHEVVDLGAVADFGCADGGAVDGGIGLHVDMVADADGAGLRDLFPVALVVLGEAEAVAADDDSVFERDVIAEDTVFANHSMGVGEEMATDLHAGIKHDMGQQCGVLTEADVGADDGVGSDVSVGANLGGGMDDGGGVDAGRVRGRLIEQAESARERVIGILDAKRGDWDFLKVGLNENGGGAGGAGEGSVLGIGDKRDFGRAGFFDAFDASDFEIGIAAEVPA